MERKMTKQKLIVMSKNNPSRKIKLTDDVIINSLKSFISKPIIEVDKTKSPAISNAIGIIDKVEYKHGLVVADVTMFTDKYKDKFRYDNWLIVFEDGERGNFNRFKYFNCELYKERS